MNRLKLLAGTFSISICIVLTFFNVRAQSAPSINTNSALFNFDGTPAGASVTVDGTHIIGITPFKTPIMIGTHTFRLMLNGYPDWQGTYTVIGTSAGIYADFDNRNPNQSGTLPNERKPAFINLLTPGYVDGWWSTDSDVLQMAVDAQDHPYLYNYNVANGTASNTDVPQTAIVDPSIRRSLALPVRNGNSVFTAAYRSPSGRYILQAQSLDQNNFTFMLNDTKTNHVYATDYKWSLDDDTGTDERSYNPAWSSDESLVWLNTYLKNDHPTILWLQNDQLKTIQFQTDPDGGMYTRPTSQGYALVWNKVYTSADVTATPPTRIYLMNLGTMASQQLPLPDGDVDIHNSTALVFSPDGQWIYAGTKEGVKRINVHNLNDVELVDPTLSEANLYQVISFSYTLHYVLVSGQGFNSFNFIYKLPASISGIVPSATPSPTVTPLATSASVPGGNQIGG